MCVIIIKSFHPRLLGQLWVFVSSFLVGISQLGSESNKYVCTLGLQNFFSYFSFYATTTYATLQDEFNRPACNTTYDIESDVFRHFFLMKSQKFKKIHLQLLRMIYFETGANQEPTKRSPFCGMFRGMFRGMFCYFW